jgi:hypothetical protein
MNQVFSCNFPCIKVLSFFVERRIRERRRRKPLLDPFLLQPLPFSLGCAQRESGKRRGRGVPSPFLF